jgi:hypothetical protein
MAINQVVHHVMGMADEGQMPVDKAAVEIKIRLAAAKGGVVWRKANKRPMMTKMR